MSASENIETYRKRRADHMTPPAVERGGQCDAHIGIVKEITQLQIEVLHMKNEFGRMATGIEKLVEKIEEHHSESRSPEVTKAWIVGAFSVFGGGISVLVAAIAHADKLAKLIGWGG